MFHDITVDCPLFDSFRVRQVAGMFDLPLEEKLRERFQVEVPGLDEPWQVGLIVGPSASGKTSVARRAFGNALFDGHVWPADRAVVDCFGDRPIKAVTQILAAVGLASPPAWVKPYAALSNGEQFRCNLAQALLAARPVVAFDEFTSVVDRTVARAGAAAVGRAVRRGCPAERFVAVTCHYDVAEWLEPDWVLDMAQGTLTRGRLRRPEIRLAVVRCRHTAWRLFARHHYLSGTVNKAAHCYLALWEGEPVAFCAVLAQPGRQGAWRISRLVVLSDFQGLGIGTRLAAALGDMYRREQRRLSITTSHPAMIAALRRSPAWHTIGVQKFGFRIQSGARSGVLTGYLKNTSRGRAVVSFRYAGEE